MSVLNLSIGEMIDRCERAQSMCDILCESAWEAQTKGERMKLRREANYWADVACQLRFVDWNGHQSG